MLSLTLFLIYIYIYAQYNVDGKTRYAPRDLEREGDNSIGKTLGAQV